MLLIGKVQNVIDAKIIMLSGLQSVKVVFFSFERYIVVTDIYKFKECVCDLGI